MSTIDLRDAFHTLRLPKTSQKYCGITPYYGSLTYHYLLMGMGMSVSSQIWQQFVDLVFQDDIIKRKQNFDVIMDDTFIHSTKEEHMDDLMDHLMDQSATKIWLENITPQMPIFQEENGVCRIRIPG